MNHYSATIKVDKTPAELFDAVCRVNEWWTGNLTGDTRGLDSVFTIRFGKTFVTMKLIEWIPDQKVTWEVVDSFLDFVSDAHEWQHTTLVWDIIPGGIRMTHVGLVPEVECFDNCQKGWDFYVKTSLLKLLTEGQGMPEKRAQQVTL
ncbi:SRPBCC domain-containing protein [Dinghuibacter silviterrae]|uniref:Activator of Hsp90 ATPase-like protein n=1 Tax=Dinghuibacter silviterrae TaxID=1539049 RepID=A0A4R8DWX7_9BACT|nr:SRPBCC domain-containing protein [Dinghuibacter silviterrae]TDX02035.1 hypothetical protein EDB95_3083 [Dinghuibacter silviterrae]